jgi:hypothetical protein
VTEIESNAIVEGRLEVDSTLVVLIGNEELTEGASIEPGRISEVEDLKSPSVEPVEVELLEDAKEKPLVEVDNCRV